MALLCRMVTEVVRTIAATASAFRIAILVICISIFGFSLKPFYNHTIHTPSSPRILGSLQRPCLTVVSLSTFLRPPPARLFFCRSASTSRTATDPKQAIETIIKNSRKNPTKFDANPRENFHQICFCQHVSDHGDVTGSDC